MLRRQVEQTELSSLPNCVKWSTVVLYSGRVECPEWVCTVVLKAERTSVVPIGSSWDKYPEWIREGREARLCGEGGYARVGISFDVCRLHRFGVQSSSSAQCAH